MRFPPRLCCLVNIEHFGGGGELRAVRTLAETVLTALLEVRRGLSVRSNGYDPKHSGLSRVPCAFQIHTIAQPGC